VIFRLSGILLFFTLSLSVFGQDYQFSQFYALPQYYNPAFVGSNLNTRFTTGYRNQWTGLQGWPGWVGAFDVYMKNMSSGAGLYLSNNKINALGFSQNLVMGQYAYRGKFNSKIRISSGIGIGFGQLTNSMNGKIYGDQLILDPVSQTTIDPLAGKTLQASYFDLQIGFLVYTQKWWASISALHPHSPKVGLEIESFIDPRINISGGYRFEMKKPADYKGEISPNAITPAILLRSQGSASQLDLGLYVHYVPFVFGLWYRGLPVHKNKSESLNHDAVTTLLGIKQNNLSIGYSYDINLSGLVSTLGGSHEITVTYEFKTKYLTLKSSKPTRGGLPCPSF
jgi:type IX secretion system PorP/SprF family membrane protein